MAPLPFVFLVHAAMYAPVESQDTQLHAALVGTGEGCRAHAEFLNMKMLPALAADVLV